MKLGITGTRVDVILKDTFDHETHISEEALHGHNHEQTHEQTDEHSHHHDEIIIVMNIAKKGVEKNHEHHHRNLKKMRGNNKFK